MPARLVVPTDDLFAWTLSGRESLLTHPDADPRTALSRERFAVRHLLETGHHVTALGHTVVGNLLGVLTGDGDTHDLPADPTLDPALDTADLHARLEQRWDSTADHRRTLVGTPSVPDDDCDRRAAHTFLEAVPAATVHALLRWAAPNWRPHRAAWPTHLVHRTGDTTGRGGRFGDHAHLLRVTTPTTTFTTAQRTLTRACQDAGLDVLHLRVNSFGDLPCPGDDTLGLRTAPPGCPSCHRGVEVDPPPHLLPGERPLPPFLHPGTPEEPHDHHLRAHLAATTAVHTVSPAVAALTPEQLHREAFALLTHPGTTKTTLRGPLERATRRHRDLADDPHLAHEQTRHTRAFRHALTAWRRHTRTPATPAARVALREATTAAGTHLALHGHDVLAIRDATGAVNHILAAPGTGGPAQDDTLAPRLFQMLSLGITGEELLQMDAAGTYPDPDTLELLAALRT